MPPRLYITDVILAGAVFGLIAAAVLMLALVWVFRRSKRTQRLERRLGLSQPSSPGQTRVLRLWRDGREVTTTVPSGPWRRSLVERVELLRREAGWEAPAKALLLGAVGLTALATALTLLISRNVWMTLVAGAAVIMIMWIYTRRRISRRTALFERQLVDALELAARSLRTGHPLLGAFRLISEELEDPIGPLFAQICQQQEMGLGLGAALQQAGAESTSPDMKLFATSVTIQLRTGGNLADMMDRVAFVIRERIRLGRRVRVLTAQTQFSKRVLLALPFVLFVLLNLVNPRYMETLYATQTGKFLLALAAAGLVVGAWMMNRLAVIRW